jgi:D-alanine-D-alanine ligase
MKKNIFVIYGGGGSEHEVSIVSSRYLIETLQSLPDVNVYAIEIEKNGRWMHNQKEVFFHPQGFFQNQEFKIQCDLAIPCLHGYPGETGEIQAMFEMYKVKYLGCDSESSKIAFNKVSTKLWLDRLGVPTTPWCFVTDKNEEQIKAAESMFKQYSGLFIKASNQGSSVGCFPVKKFEDIRSAITSALKYSNYAICERLLVARELEVSVYEYEGKILASKPGEIIAPGGFYSYEEKYSPDSKTQTLIEAKNLTAQQVQNLQQYAIDAFKYLKLRHLSRVDFFLTQEGQIYLNEINTFPGMTPISMFPKMMENSGLLFRDFISFHVKNLLG